ncbi:MAG: PKD domain-containing protein [Bacteroidetes bacterium]|nr:PKD domain-containing protein [Bacteroidota bacterium]
MKIIYSRFFSIVFAASAFLLLNTNYSHAQESKAGNNFILNVNNTAGFDENTLRARMKVDGLSDPVIDKLIAQRKLLSMNGKSVEWIGMKKASSTPVPFAACSDMGAENGWGAWCGAAGTSGPPSFGGQSCPPPASNGSTGFNLTAGAGIDACTPGFAPGSPTIPVVCPGFGNASIQLGVPQMPNCYAEQITYPLTVTPADTNFIYAYAIVLEDPGHDVANQPFVDLCIYDSAGNPVPCGCFRYTGGPNLPGFFSGSCGAYYKPWTLVGVNLKPYIGQTLNIVITNVDCGYCGHFAHSYWDFSCGSISGSATGFCPGQSTSLCGPIDPSITYTYQWYQNGNPYTGPPSATAQCITPIVNIGDTFSVEVQQPSGCNFHLVYVPQPMSITPNFNFTMLCGTVNFTDLSTTSNGSPIAAWNWSFPGGNPTSSTAQNPTVTYPAGSYTATLIVTTQAGCIDTIVQPVNVLGLPQAAFASTTVCSGNSTQFTDNSVAAAGDPLVLWNWVFIGGNPATSTSQNPSVTYPPGNYTAVLTVTSQQGCVSTYTQAVTVNPLPVANMSSINLCFNNITPFTDLSVGNNTISNYNWSFGDGSFDTVQSNPTHTYGNPGTYTVTLIVTNNFGCKDTNTITVTVNPLPVAAFGSLPVCFHDSTCFLDSSTISTGSITSWGWNFADPASGANNISNSQNPCHIFTGLGPYQVLLTVTSDSGCQSNTIVAATINPLPVALINPVNVCHTFSSCFTDGSTPAGGDPLAGWDWDFGDATPHSNLQNPCHTYAAPGTYTLTLIVTSTKGCKDTVTNTAIVYSNPIALFTKPDSGCAPQTFGFTDLSQSASGVISAWQWSFQGGSPSSSTLQNGSSYWPTPGSYDVQLIVTTQYGCKDTLLMPQYVNIFAWPVADFCVTPSEASVNEPIFDFCDLWSNDVTQWTWNFGDGTNDIVSTDPIHSYSAVVTNNDYYTYQICVDVKNVHGCYDSICRTVDLLPEFEFNIPNCFTPNGDLINDSFFGKSRGVKDYNIWLFDRWGNLIWDCHFEGKNTNWDSFWQDGMSSACKWDGKVEGGNSSQQVQEDVYVWKVRLTDIFDKVHTYVGHVSSVK